MGGLLAPSLVLVCDVFTDMCEHHKQIDTTISGRTGRGSVVLLTDTGSVLDILAAETMLGVYVHTRP